VPSRRLRREIRRRDRSQNDRSRRGPVRGRGGGVSGRQRAGGPPYSARPSRSRGAPRRHGRYVLWSALSLVAVGIGAAAFGMGGGSGEPAPRITPQLEMFSIEHAINSGDVPFPDPTKTPAQPSPGVTGP